MCTSKPVLAIICLVACAVATTAVVAKSAFDSSADAQEMRSRGALQQAVDALGRQAGEHVAVRRVVVTPGHAPRIERARRGERAGFPLAWVNPLGDRQAVEVVRSWTAPHAFTPTRIVLGRRDGRGRLAWRVEGRRRGHAELWLLAPNGTLLSHRRR